MAESLEKETGRVEAFSDGVFAIAITLLVLEFKVPHLPAGASGRDLFLALLDLWPSMVAFLGSFGAILIMWINHHGLFRLIHKTDSPFLSPPSSPRGRNEPMWVSITAEWVAAQRRSLPETFGDTLIPAYDRVFRGRS